MNTSTNKTLGFFWKQWVKPMIVVVAIIAPLRSSLADWNDVPTGSMKPTIVEGDRILVNKLAYDLKVPLTTHRLAQWGDPQRGDIVVCLSPSDGTRLVKRVIALPGDTIAMQNNTLFVNGIAAAYSMADEVIINHIPENEQEHHVILQEDILDHQHAVMFTPGLSSPHTFQTVTIPADSYAVMGDNRDNSFDSRLFGFVSREQILGRSRRVVLSLDYDNFFLPRAERWWKKLN